jgi:hypothetical protein
MNNIIKNYNRILYCVKKQGITLTPSQYSRYLFRINFSYHLNISDSSMNKYTNIDFSNVNGLKYKEWEFQ